MAPGTEVKPPRISTGSALSAMICSAKDTFERAPHMMPVTSATMPAANQTMTQIWFERDADRERRLVAVGDGAQRAADAGFLEEEGEHGDHDGGDDGGRDVDLLQRDEAAEDLEVDRALGQIELLGDHHASDCRRRSSSPSPISK